MHTDPGHRVGSLARAAVFVALLSALLGAPRAEAGSVALTWTSPGDDGVAGQASRYDLRYSETAVGADTASWWASATVAASLPAPAPAGTRESVVVAGLPDGKTYYFAIRVADEVPNWSGFSNIAPKQTSPSGTLATPTGFAASMVPGAVRLTWDLLVSTGETGFKLYRGASGGPPPAPLATLPLAATTYSDTTVLGGSSYEYRLTSYRDTLESTPAVATISIPEDELLTTSTDIHGYPNPARGQVTFRFSLSASSTEGATRVTIFSLTGRRIRQLADEVLPPGEHTVAWDCRSDRGHAVAPGLYNVILDGPSGRSVTRLVIVP